MPEPRLQSLALTLSAAAWLAAGIAIGSTIRPAPEPPAPSLPSIACAWRCPAT